MLLREPLLAIQRRCNGEHLCTGRDNLSGHTCEESGLIIMSLYLLPHLSPALTTPMSVQCVGALVTRLVTRGPPLSPEHASLPPAS